MPPEEEIYEEVQEQVSPEENERRNREIEERERGLAQRTQGRDEARVDGRIADMNDSLTALTGTLGTDISEEQSMRMRQAEERLTGERASQDGEAQAPPEIDQQAPPERLQQDVASIAETAWNDLPTTVDTNVREQRTPADYMPSFSFDSPPAQPTPVIDQASIRSRQSDLVDSEIFNNRVTVIGAGAIGSFVTLTLAKMGFRNLTVFDHDHVSTENIANQFYRYNDIQQQKVHALGGMIHDFENLSIEQRNHLWLPEHELKGYVVMAVDSMSVRNNLYRAIKRNADVYGFIDGRMGGQQGEVYSVDLINAEQKKIYEGYLWKEDEASELPCTQKAVMYNVLWIASQIANNLRLMMEEKPFPPVMLMDFENVNHINVEHK